MLMQSSYFSIIFIIKKLRQLKTLIGTSIWRNIYRQLKRDDKNKLDKFTKKHRQ